MNDPWPWESDTPLERARRVARSYREALESANPTMCERLDRKVSEFGQTWIQPVEVRWEQLSAKDIENMLGIPATTIRAWASKGRITKLIADDGSPVYMAEEVRSVAAQSRRTAT